MNLQVSADAWDGDREAVISNWLYADGDEVGAGALVAEIMVEKTAIELFAEASGRLEILVPADQAVQPGQVVGRLHR